MKTPFYLALALVLFAPSLANSQALELARPFNGYINKAVASTLGKRLTALGFAANDPIYTATMSAAQTTVSGAIAAGSVAATVASIGTAPVWLSVALALGAAYDIYQFHMGQNTWSVAPSTTKAQIIPPDATKAPPMPDPWTPATYPTVQQLPTDYIAAPGVSNTLPSDMPVCGYFLSNQYGVGNVPAVHCGATVADMINWRDRHLYNGFKTYLDMVGVQQNTYGTTWTIDSVQMTLLTSTDNVKMTCVLTPGTCPEGIWYQYTRQVRYDMTSTGATVSPVTTNYVVNIFSNPKYIDPNKTYNLNDAAANLSTADLSSRADPELLAALASRIWQNAAQQPGYQGAPYDVNNPVTAQDIEADIAAGLYPWPTVADLLSLTVANGQTQPVLDPTATPSSQPATQTTATVDLGPDPTTPAPTLEDTPTGLAIVSQVMGLLPSLSAFTMPSHQSTCTAPTFDFFSHTYSLQSMCDLLEQQRALLSTIFSAVWGVAALTLVLRA